MKRGRPFSIWRFWRWALGSLPALALVSAAHAQVNLPQVRVPQLPVDLPVDVNRTLGNVTDRLDPENLVDLRKLQIRELVRRNRDVIERDPKGEPIIRSEVTAFSPTEDALSRARAAGFAVIREKVLEGLDAKIVVLQSPPGMSTRRALQQLRKLDPDGAYDFNHIYSASGELAPAMEAEGILGRASLAESAGAMNLQSERALSTHRAGGLTITGHARGAINSSAAIGGVATNLASLAQVAAGTTTTRLVANESNANQGGRAAQTVKIGLIDGGVDARHGVFRETTVHQYGCKAGAVPSAHGTAVASLIAGRSAKFHGAMPGAVLYAADVYCGQPTGGAVDAVADAFAWLSRERVPVINVSLVGPSNVTLQNVVRVVTSRGFIVVAAVGNDGPAAPPLYPASYPDVIGVTGVDARERALLEAARGKQVDFAAPGADMAAAGMDQSYATVRGTSFAAPIVAGLLASSMSQPDKAGADRAIASLTQQAVDLGARGLDSTYGNGLVGKGLRMEPALAKVRED